MRKEFIWEVIARNTPLLKRKCKHCNNDSFYCSEKFRVNAQKKKIDIWLIYRCIKCDSTYNLTIFTRTKTELINKDLFNKFLENNLEIVWKYAFSYEVSRENKVELDFNCVEYDINYEYISVEDILHLDCEIIAFKLKYPFDFNLKLSTIVRKCFMLSASKLDKLIEAKVISINEKHLHKKQKVKNNDIVTVNRLKLLDII